MEFKDKLRALRKERGISQQALADAIFTSRSAVAKWENGLGLPSEDSLNALLNYFGVTKEQLMTEEPEVVITEKNRRFRRLNIIWGLLIGLIVIPLYIILFVDIINDNYGLTSKGAAGAFADNPCIHTEDYDIYYSSITELEGVPDYECISSFRPVKKLLFGYYVFEEDYEHKQLYSDGEYVGIFYSLKGKDCYYNIFRAATIIQEDGIYTPGWLIQVPTVCIGGIDYPVTVNSLFITDKPVTEFYVGEHRVTVGEE